MQPHQLTPAQKAKIKKREERRRREQERRADQYRKRIERLRRQIEEARRRRQRLLLMFLFMLLAALESARPKFTLFTTRPQLDPTDWTPSPENDFAPKHGADDHCDGYSCEQWHRMLDERGIRLSRKAELRATWEAHPERELFPTRYQNWDHRPYIGQIMAELTAPYWRADAFAALKLLTPHEVHTYLDEAYTAGSAFRECLADRDADIIRAFQNRALLWGERKRREVEELQKAEKDKKPDGDEKKFEP